MGVGGGGVGDVADVQQEAFVELAAPGRTVLRDDGGGVEVVAVVEVVIVVPSVSKVLVHALQRRAVGERIVTSAIVFVHLLKRVPATAIDEATARVVVVGRQKQRIGECTLT